MSITVIILLFLAVAATTGFAVLVIALVPAIHQLRLLMADLEKTSTEVRDLARELKRVSQHVEEELQEIDVVIEHSREAAGHISQTFHFINENLLKRAVGVLSFLPALKIGWNLVKRIKGGNK